MAAPLMLDRRTKEATWTSRPTSELRSEVEQERL
jgi:hypothetical protein